MGQKAWRLAGFGVIEIPIHLRKLNLIDQLNSARQSQWFNVDRSTEGPRASLASSAEIGYGWGNWIQVKYETESQQRINSHNIPFILGSG
jgi:hypothetical protein